MGEAFAKFFEFIREYIPPWKIVRIDQQGSKFRGGNPVGVMTHANGFLGSGLHFFWPYYETIMVFDIAYQGVRLDSQDNATLDNVPLKFKAYIGYEIFDAQMMDVNVADFDDTLRGEAEMWLAEKIAEKTYVDLIASRKSLRSELKRSLDTRVSKWGVKLVTVGFTTFVQSKQYTVHGSSLL